MEKTQIEKLICDFVGKRGQCKLTELTQHYDYYGTPVSKAEIQAVGRELIKRGVLVKVDDYDNMGKKLKNVVILNEPVKRSESNEKRRNT